MMIIYHEIYLEIFMYKHFTNVQWSATKIFDCFNNIKKIRKEWKEIKI